MYTKLEQIRKLTVDNVTLSEKEVTNTRRGDARINPMAPDWSRSISISSVYFKIEDRYIDTQIHGWIHIYNLRLHKTYPSIHRC